MTGIYEIINSPILWLIIWIALCIGRDQLHIAIRSFTRIIHNGLRLTSHSVLRAEKRLENRNKEVLMAEGIEDAERSIERKFERINTAVERDLSKYPAIQRKLSEIVSRLEEDYRDSTDVPPELPNWVTIIEAIANIKHTGDSLVSKMLEEIKITLETQHKKAIQTYEGSLRKRHSLLNKMLPSWRKLKKLFEEVGGFVTELNTRSKSVDRFMDDYEQIRQGTDQAMRRVSSSSLTQFFIAGFAMLIAVGGAVINFHLIALPMSEMVGGASYIGNFKTSDVAGMVIILLELSMGLFLMESLRITRLFPIIGNMDDKKRKWMIFISLTLLTVLAGIESSLAFMRDRIATDMEALRQSLSGIEQTAQAKSMIPMIGQMVMGFIFPFVLAFVAIPLESFIKSSRTVLGITAAGLLRMLAFLLRLIGSLLFHTGNFLIRMSDLVTFPRLLVDKYLPKGSEKNKETAKTGKKSIQKREIPEEDMLLGEEPA
ncbi:MAG: hypothetical protein JXL81_05625 [Deltaproteobacteria bacterium]|nr:hypothetical protein [Deltaproteobacteria bacterium]